MQILTPAQAAEVLDTPVSTLHYWRHRGTGPRSFKIGKRVMYKRADVEQWLQQQHDTTSVGDTGPGGQA